MFNFLPDSKSYDRGQMRQGENPQKRSESGTRPPEAITVAVLIYIPDETGFYERALDSFRLCLASIRKHADQPFDLLVLDNGSCDKVRSYLKNELSEGRVNYLISNSRNVGKMNAVFQMLWAAPGDYIFYSDGDIYYRPGWMKAHLDIMKTFPNVGFVGGVPLRNQADGYTTSTYRWIEDNPHQLVVEKGNLIPEAWTREYLRSVDQEKFIENWSHLQDCKVSYQGVEAYVGASHMQYLIHRSTLERIPRYRSDKAISKQNDFMMDTFLDSHSYLRLSAHQPYVYHIGNAISEDWLEDEFRALVQEEPRKLAQPVNAGSHWFWGRSKVKRLLRWMYVWAFDKYYQVG
jgi:glycosyltransferase involved in cell wall biosynthesis